MANTVYFLSTCDTCTRILNELHIGTDDFRLIDIKVSPLSPEEVDELARLAGSYEALISKRATLWKTENLSAQQLSENDYRNLLLRHYTFLKRPVICYRGQLFTGNDKKTVAAAAAALAE